jgi:hypothetical protein
MEVSFDLLFKSQEVLGLDLFELQGLLHALKHIEASLYEALEEQEQEIPEELENELSLLDEDLYEEAARLETIIGELTYRVLNSRNQ